MVNQKIDAAAKPAKNEQVLMPVDVLMEQVLRALKTTSTHQNSVIIFCNSIEQVDQMHAALSALKPDDILLHVWSAWEHSPFSPVSSSILQKLDRLKTLHTLVHQEKPSIIFCTPESWIQPTTPLENWENLIFPIEINQDLRSHEHIRESLSSLGYVKCDLVEEPGQ